MLQFPTGNQGCRGALACFEEQELRQTDFNFTGSQETGIRPGNKRLRGRKDSADVDLHKNGVAV